jgi:hypothetical protein
LASIARRHHRGRLLVTAEGAVVFAKACKLGLEGIVSKQAGSLHKSGRNRIGEDEEPGFCWEEPCLISCTSAR